MKNFSSNSYFKDLVLLFFLTLIVYWPLSLNLLSLKNDALVQYLAYRYHLSEAVRHGYLPLWNPYLYTGFPIHADMQGEVWNPLVLFLSLISKYDMTILQWEVLIYLFLAAVGMYRLVKYLGLSRQTAICCGIAFMSCGYMTDSISVIPWIPSAAFIPFILLYFLRSLKSLLLSDAIKLSLCLSLMFLCGYPSFFIFLNYILGCSFIIWSIYQIKEDKKTVFKVLLHLGISYLLFMLICSPAIISYYQFLPFYSRGSGISYEKAAQNPLVPFSFLTYLLPNAASKANFLPTDLSMRNAYVGLFVFFFFLISLKKLNRFKIIILVFTVFSCLFSLGSLTPVQKISYHLPLINTFRHPGTIRVFTSVGIILLAAYPLDLFFKQKRDIKVKWFGYASLIAFFILAVYLIATNTTQFNSINFSLRPAALKELLYSISFESFSLILCGLQILFVLLFLIWYQQKKISSKSFAGLFVLNSIVFAWIGLTSVVSQYKTSDVNNYIHSFPSDYPLPDVNASMESEINSDSIQISPHGYHNFYNKKIVVQDHIITPTLNTDYNKFLEDGDLRLLLKDHPFVYVSKDSISIQPSNIRLEKFTPNSFSFIVNTSVAGNLQLFQQYNPNWKAFINGKSVSIQKSNIAFMSVSIPVGTSSIEWKYSPKKVYAAIIVSILSLLTIAFYFLIKTKQKKVYE